MIKHLFDQMAGYNRWANARLYAAALALPDEAYRRQLGVFFGSLHATLNHILTADRIWLKRLTGEGAHPDRLNAIIHEDLKDLARARIAEDQRIVALVSGYAGSDFESIRSYQTLNGQPHDQRIADILQHVFNHQTHHRGQAHACLSMLSTTEPPSLDLLMFQRDAPAPDLGALLS